MSDPEHPGVWGHLALMCLQQGREADAAQALTQALRHGLNKPEILVDIADQFQALAQFNKASQLLQKVLSMGVDTVKVRSAVRLGHCTWCQNTKKVLCR